MHPWFYNLHLTLVDPAALSVLRGNPFAAWVEKVALAGRTPLGRELTKRCSARAERRRNGRPDRLAHLDTQHTNHAGSPTLLSSISSQIPIISSASTLREPAEVVAFPIPRLRPHQPQWRTRARLSRCRPPPSSAAPPAPVLPAARSPPSAAAPSEVSRLLDLRSPIGLKI